MWDLIEAIHKALGSDSTVEFIVVAFILCGALGGGAAFLVDKGYKNSEQYREAHKEPVLAVEWHMAAAPAAYPQSGRILMLQTVPIPAENGGGGLAEMYGRPGQQLGWNLGFSAIECTVTNYSKETIFNITADLHLRFLRAIKVENPPGGLRGGDQFLSRSWPIYISKIDPGPGQTFVFYVANFYPDQFVFVAFPETVTGQSSKSEERKVITVILPSPPQVTMLPPYREPVAN
ncbi:MAG TPA: hypothetical protein VGZ48_14400 [Candidatus Acidoferrales bacterium]|jgi:hypothetical protein|nr:hypothetical protein [Candidatus Acidoferrales bacterium]